MSRHLPVLSGSKLALVVYCQWFARPDVEHHDVVGRPAIFGRAGHTCCERHLDRKPVDVLAIAREYDLTDDETRELGVKWEHARDFLARNAKTGWRAEVPFAYSFETGEGLELPKGEYHRDYRACPPGFVPMTLDVIGWTQIADPETSANVLVPFVLDWKWGYGAGVDDPTDNGQLQGQALAVAAAWGVTRVLVVVAHVRENRVDLRETLFDAELLAKAHERLAGFVALIPTSEPAPGDHCTDKFCSAICPKAQTAIVAAAETRDLRVDPSAFKFSPVIESNEHAVWLLQMRAAANVALKQIDDALEKYADEHGITREAMAIVDAARVAGNSTETWGAIETPQESPDLEAPGALAILEAEGVTLKPKASWKDMGKAAPRVREKLRAIGALKITKKTTYDWRRAG